MGMGGKERDEEVQTTAAGAVGTETVGPEKEPIFLGKTAVFIGKTAVSLAQVTEVVGKTAEVLGKAAKVLGRTAEVLGRTVKVLGRTVEVLGKTVEVSGKTAEFSGRTAKVLAKTTEVSGKTAEVSGKTAEFSGKTFTVSGGNPGAATALDPLVPKLSLGTHLRGEALLRRRGCSAGGSRSVRPRPPADTPSVRRRTSLRRSVPKQSLGTSAASAERPRIGRCCESPVHGAGGCHCSSKKPARRILPGWKASGGVLRSTIAQSGSFGVWSALFSAACSRMVKPLLSTT
jgi:hypothetical protein